MTKFGFSGVESTFYFQVKFYPPEPALLQEDLTRLVFRTFPIKCINIHLFLDINYAFNYDKIFFPESK
jgi:hypothetical protein